MNLEERLRPMLADDRLALPAWPDPVARVHAGMARRRRLRRMFGAAGAALLAVIAAAGWTTALVSAGPQPSPSPSATTVPWSDDPVGSTVLFPPPSPRPNARPCVAADLATTAEVTNDGGAGGHGFWAITIENASPSRCTLSGSAGLTATDVATGVRGPVPTEPTGLPGSIAASYQAPATIDPGEPATLQLVTRGGCGGGATLTSYRDIALDVLGRTYSLGTLRLDTACVLQESDWLLNIQLTPREPLPYTKLVPTIEAPRTVRAGDWFDFTVTLANPTDSPVMLDPCPAYRMNLFKSGGAYFLNCAVIEIPAHGSVRFAMRIQLADYAVPGPTRLSWQFIDDGAASPLASTIVTVIG